MAFTISKEPTILGNKRVMLITCSVDSPSGNVDTGLSIVDGYSFSPVSMATAGIKIARNVGSGATSRPGFININSAVTGDSFFLVVYGR